LRLFAFGGYGLALAALALVVFGAIECPPPQNLLFLSPTRFFEAKADRGHGGDIVLKGRVSRPLKLSSEKPSFCSKIKM